MSVDDGGGRTRPKPEDIDTGEPIAELASLERPASAGFLGRLRRRIARRQLTGQIVELSAIGPAEMFFEFLRMLFGLLTAGAPSKNREKRDE